MGKWFDESCEGWDKDADVSRFFLVKTQQYFNERLRAYGHVFLNEVYDSLGIQRTVIGSQMGWIYDPEDPKRANYIDFGLKNDFNRDFINGWEKTAYLTFNYDGPILTCLPEK